MLGKRTHASIATGSDSAEVTGSSPSSCFDSEIGEGFTTDSLIAAQVRSDPYRLFCPTRPHRLDSNIRSSVKISRYLGGLD